MLIISLKVIFRRDLEKLKQEIDLYQYESNLWKVKKNISNSAGNLCLHIIGNLNYFIGAEIGKTDYVRKRELEFSQNNISKNELKRKINETIQIIESSLDQLTEEKLWEDYPIKVFSEKMSTGYFLIHLTSHLSYHLGQINYHRRLLDI